MNSPITTDLDLEAPGKRTGYLRVPRSTNTSGWSALYIGIGCIVNGVGPTVLVLGGNHGDEYEGQVTALNFLRDTELADVQGRIIVIPCLSPEASRAGTRLWPSGANFNRSFPGSPNGSPAEILADYLTRVLFPLSDVVMDLHSGGRSMVFAPMSHMHLVPDAKQRGAMLDGMLAWNTNHHMIYIDVAGVGLLPVEAEEQGKVVITTELGGGGFLTTDVLNTARDGLANVLRTLGVLSGTPVTRADLGLEPARTIDSRDPAGYLNVPESGLYEVMVSPGDHVTEGQVVGRVHFPDRLDRLPLPVRATFDGYVATVKAIPTVEQGDCVTTIGRLVDPETLR